MAGVGVEPTTFVTTDEVADALGYYEREVIDGREDYLSESGTSPGHWVGSLAAADGYAGVAQRDHLARAFSGVHPDGFKMTAHDLTVPGFDMTLSPSKSLSLLWALGSDDDARSVEQGLYAARREVERFLEADGCFVRRGHAGASVEHGSGFFGAVFMHRTSRLGDPGIHLHWTVFNVTEGPEDAPRSTRVTSTVCATPPKLSSKRRFGESWWNG